MNDRMTASHISCIIKILDVIDSKVIKWEPVGGSVLRYSRLLRKPEWKIELRIVCKSHEKVANNLFGEISCQFIAIEYTHIPLSIKDKYSTFVLLSE